LFFDPVVSGCNRNDDYHCDQDGGALHPAVFETFGGDAEHQGDDCGCAEDAEHLVFEGVNDLGAGRGTIYQREVSGLVTGRFSPKCCLRYWRVSGESLMPVLVGEGVLWGRL
jgi:hypothetical protein